MLISNYVYSQTKDDKVWYNAFEKDIAIANFYVSKPTALGNKTKLEHNNNSHSIYFLQNTEGVQTWAGLTSSPR